MQVSGSGPGPDKVSANVLICSWNQVLPTIRRIFKDSIRLGYIPTAWQSSNGIFISKPSKPTYTDIKNWRVINLSSSLLKLLEKVVYLYLDTDLKIDSSLSPNQLGFRVGHSTEEALHKIVTGLESAVTSGKFALSCFVDIKSAFDCISFKSIISALHLRKVHPILIQWITSLLTSRKVIFSLRGESLIRYITSGTPQGGVLSPLLWNIVIDSLLCSLNQFLEPHEIAQGFADDLVTILIGDDLSALLRRKQQIIYHIEEWCRSQGLELCSSKTSLVLFTWKRKFLVDYTITVNGKPIEFTDQVRYLGVILDKKLNWKYHADFVSSKANQTLSAAKRALGKNWGLSATTVKWIYNSVVVPKLTYCCHVWGQGLTEATSRKLLGSQTLACRSIIHCPRHTSLKSMTLTSGLIPVTYKIKERGLGIALRLKAHNQFSHISTSRTKTKPHSELLCEQLEHIPGLSLECNLSSRHSLDVPQFTFGVAIKELQEELRVSHQSVINRSDLTCFTDGSKINDRTGAGLVIYQRYSEQPFIQKCWRLQDNNTVFQAELSAIDEACKVISNLPLSPFSSIQMFKDSLASINALTAEYSTSKQCIKVRQGMDVLASMCNLDISWIKGHSNITGNDLADTQAKHGTSMEHITAVPLPFSFLKKQISDSSSALFKNDISSWDTSNPLKPVLIAFSDQSFQGFFKSLQRRDSRIITSFLDNRAPLLAFLHKIGLSSDPFCNLCFMEPQTNIHVLNVCPALTRYRHSTFNHYYLSHQDLSSITPSKLLDFLRISGIYDSFL